MRGLAGIEVKRGLDKNFPQVASGFPARSVAARSETHGIPRTFDPKEYVASAKGAMIENAIERTGIFRVPIV
jgi:hypothetical protein